MRILQIIPSLSPKLGGPTFAAVGMTEALARRGHKVHLFTTNADGEMPNVESTLDPSIDFRLFPVFPSRVCERFRYSRLLAKAVEQVVADVDLVHIHYLYLFPTIAAGLAAQRARVPYIIRPCGSLDPKYLKRSVAKKWLINAIAHRKVMRGSASFHFTTEEEKTQAAPYVLGRPGFVVPNGVDFRLFNRLPPRGGLRLRYPELTSKKIVLFFGRISYIKGFEYLIPAFAKSSKENENAHLVIAGPDGGYLNVVRRLIEEYNLLDKVTFTGLLTNESRLDALVDSDIFILPSYSENFANSLFEAMAAGLPAIVSDKVMTSADVIASGGGIVLSNDVQLLSGAIDKLLNDDNLRMSMGRRARAYVKDNYSWDSIGGRLEKSYEETLGASM